MAISYLDATLRQLEAWRDGHVAMHRLNSDVAVVRAQNDKLHNQMIALTGEVTEKDKRLEALSGELAEETKKRHVMAELHRLELEKLMASKELGPLNPENKRKYPHCKFQSQTRRYRADDGWACEPVSLDSKTPVGNHHTECMTQAEYDSCLATRNRHQDGTKSGSYNVMPNLSADLLDNGDSITMTHNHKGGPPILTIARQSGTE